jgi:hypothetical protein
MGKTALRGQCQQLLSFLQQSCRIEASDPTGSETEIQRSSQCVGMRESACFGSSQITARACPIEESQAGLSQRQLCRQKHQRVDGSELQILAPPDRIEKRDPFL